MTYKKALYWFTHDLRLKNNTLLDLMATEVEQACFVYIIDATEFNDPIFQGGSMGVHRKQFLYSALKSLSTQLSALGHRLLVFSGHPHSIIKQLTQQLSLEAVYTSKQIGLNEKKMVENLRSDLPHIHFKESYQTMLFDFSDTSTFNELFSGFSSFRKYVEQNQLTITAESNENRPLPSNLLALNTLTIQDSLASLIRHIPKLPKPYLNSGEKAANTHLSEYFNSDAPSTYKITRNALDHFPSSTKLSPYLANGNLSVKAVWHRVLDYECQQGANESTYWIKFELLWREFFQWLALHSGATLFTLKGCRTQPPLTSFYPERFQKWACGNTPYPIVNACMKQLNATGYMSNRGRQLTASCLIHELNHDWRYGAAYFQQQLIDFNVGANWGNWQYIAGVGVDPRGGRQFNLEKQTQRYDPNRDFINKWSPQTEELMTPLDSQDMVGWPIHTKYES